MVAIGIFQLETRRRHLHRKHLPLPVLERIAEPKVVLVHEYFHAHSQTTFQITLSTFFRIKIF